MSQTEDSGNTGPTGRMSLRELAYVRLRADIVTCRLAPGQRVTERGLALETGLGMSAVREALARLDHDGLIRTLPRRGYQVTPLTLEVVDDLFVLWRMVGPEITRLGVERASDEQRDRLLLLFDQLGDPRPQESSATAEALRRVELSSAAFDLLAQATDNEYVRAVYHRLLGDLSRVFVLVWADHFDDLLAVDDVRWGELLRSRDGRAAAEQGRAYVARSHALVLDVVRRWPVGTAGRARIGVGLR